MNLISRDWTAPGRKSRPTIRFTTTLNVSGADANKLLGISVTLDNRDPFTDEWAWENNYATPTPYWPEGAVTRGWVDERGKVHVQVLRRVKRQASSDPAVFMHVVLAVLPGTGGCIYHDTSYAPSTSIAMDASPRSPNYIHVWGLRNSSISATDIIRYGPMAILRYTMREGVRL